MFSVHYLWICAGSQILLANILVPLSTWLVVVKSGLWAGPSPAKLCCLLHLSEGAAPLIPEMSDCRACYFPTPLTEHRSFKAKHLESIKSILDPFFSLSNLQHVIWLHNNFSQPELLGV